MSVKVVSSVTRSMVSPLTPPVRANSPSPRNFRDHDSRSGATVGSIGGARCGSTSLAISPNVLVAPPGASVACRIQPTTVRPDSPSDRMKPS